jgi:hypothetical protein
MFLKPFVDIVEEVLPAPQHPGQRLSHHIGGIFAETRRGYRPVEIVGLAPPRLDDLCELHSGRVLDVGCGYYSVEVG